MTGVSHWVEHMNFKGTTNIPRDQVKGIIERFGGSWNGYTWLDQTTYLETATTDALDRMLFIEAERMASCLYDPADCESERTVIISELQGGENDPEQRLDTEITATAFKAHPYRHPTIGWIHDLRTMTREDLYGHYRRYYVPNNATLVVVGDVDAADARAPRRARPSDASPPGAPAAAGRRPRSRRRKASAGCTCASPAPRPIGGPPSTPRASPIPTSSRCCALDAVLTGASGLNIWSGGKVPTPQRGARLYRGARQPRPGLVGRRLPGADRRAVPLLAERDRRRRPVAGGGRGGGAGSNARASPPPGPTAAELATVQAQLRARFVYDGDSVTDVAHQLGYFATIGRWQDWHEAFARLAAVTVDDVHAAARRYLAADNRTIGVFEPTRPVRRERAAT